MGQAPVTQTITRTARRRFLSALSSLAMLGRPGGRLWRVFRPCPRFLYPVRSGSKNWLFVAPANRLNRATTCAIRPRRERLSISPVRARLAALAISSPFHDLPPSGLPGALAGSAPALFLPCHNGVFDASGRGTGGPPGDAGQTLPHYRLRLERGLLFIDMSGVSAA